MQQETPALQYSFRGKNEHLKEDEFLIGKVKPGQSLRIPFLFSKGEIIQEKQYYQIRKGHLGSYHPSILELLEFPVTVPPNDTTVREDPEFQALIKAFGDPLTFKRNADKGEQALIINAEKQTTNRMLDLNSPLGKLIDNLLQTTENQVYLIQPGNSKAISKKDFKELLLEKSLSYDPDSAWASLLAETTLEKPILGYNAAQEDHVDDYSPTPNIAFVQWRNLSTKNISVERFSQNSANEFIWNQLQQGYRKNIEALGHKSAQALSLQLHRLPNGMELRLYPADGMQEKDLAINDPMMVKAAEDLSKENEKDNQLYADLETLQSQEERASEAKKTFKLRQRRSIQIGDAEQATEMSEVDQKIAREIYDDLKTRLSPDFTDLFTNNSQVLLLSPMGVNPAHKSPYRARDWQVAKDTESEPVWASFSPENLHLVNKHLHPHATPFWDLLSRKVNFLPNQPDHTDTLARLLKLGYASIADIPVKSKPNDIASPEDDIASSLEKFEKMFRENIDIAELKKDELTQFIQFYNKEMANNKDNSHAQKLHTLYCLYQLEKTYSNHHPYDAVESVNQQGLNVQKLEKKSPWEAIKTCAINTFKGDLGAQAVFLACAVARMRLDGSDRKTTQKKTYYNDILNLIDTIPNPEEKLSSKINFYACAVQYDLPETNHLLQSIITESGKGNNLDHVYPDLENAVSRIRPHEVRKQAIITLAQSISTLNKTDQQKCFTNLHSLASRLGASAKQTQEELTQYNPHPFSSSTKDVQEVLYDRPAALEAERDTKKRNAGLVKGGEQGR